MVAPSASRFDRASLRIAVLVPGLMLLAGGTLVWMGHAALSQRVEETMRDRVVDQAASIARAAEDCLEQAPPLLAFVRNHALVQPQADPPSFTALGAALMRHRPGISYISLSYADGSFLGVYVDHERDGVVRLNQSWIEPDGTTTQRYHDIVGNAGLVPAETFRDVKYDPRTRPFFAPAVAAKQPVWTPPYSFFNRSETGITCAEAIRDPITGELIAVATVDFDLATLSDVLRTVVATGTPGSAAFVFTAAGEVLAGSDATSSDLDLADRRAAFAALIPRLPKNGDLRFFDLSTGGMPALAGVRRIAATAGHEWFAGIEAPRDAFVATANQHLRRQMWVALTALSFAVGVAALLARYLARQQRLTREANAAAESAERRLQAMGSYTLLHQLGSGGMGTVWKAEHQMLARPAALKLINFAHLGYGDSERARAQERFEREAKATARLRSRNTVTLYDYGVAADGSFYYAMELLDGLDLDRLVTEYRAQPAGRVIDLMIQICNSLAEAHAQGLVHRDIKPANIYLCRLGTEVDVVKVLDFGLVTERARANARASDRGVVRGTPAFMAPEQAQSRPVDGRADLYALGCVAYWLLTGRTVFDNEDPMTAMLDHITVAPTPIASLVPAIPEGLATIVMRLLAKDPAQRPADAAAVIEALRSAAVPVDQAWGPDRAEAWWKMNRPSSAPETDELPLPAARRTMVPAAIQK